MGKPFPDTDGEPLTGESIYQSVEDDPNDTITPRLFALGADCDKVSDISVPFNDIDKDCEVLENASARSARKWRRLTLGRPISGAVTI